MAARISPAGTTLAADHSSLASSGMNSMKRTATPRSRPKRAKSTASSSLTPRITTTLTLTGAEPGGHGGVDAVEHGGQSVAAGELREAVAAAASRG